MDRVKAQNKTSPGYPIQAWHAQPADEIEHKLATHLKDGLTEREANLRLEQSGQNRLQEEKPTPFWKEFLEELREPMVLLLLFTGVLYAIWGEMSDAITIFFVILTLNTIEVFNEQRAKKAIYALRKLAEPSASVIRSGAVQEIPTERIVPGDLLLLMSGRRVPADARLIEAIGLAVDESSLTGESVPAEKEGGATLPAETPLADRNNMVYSGTLVRRGRGNAVVVNTGMATEIGKVATLAREVKEPRTPLQKAMSELSRWMVWLAIGFSVIVPVLGVLVARQPLKTMLLTGLSLAFATIPEEMPIIITMVLGLGAYRLSKQNAIIKRLKAVETLGAITVIATDKTGTLTENRMEVNEWLPAQRRSQLLAVGVLCNEAILSGAEATGDPLETALLRAAQGNGIDVHKLQDEFPLTNEFTFDNTRKRMSVVRQEGDRMWVLAKGAPESILAISDFYADQASQDRESFHPLKDAERHSILEQAAGLAGRGLRVIAIAEKKLPGGIVTQDEAESHLVFLGMVALADPPRPEVRQAIGLCFQAGIRPIMITGDHPLTARSIAGQVGLDGNGSVLTGMELDALPDEELQRQVRQVSIFARTTPENKLRIVQALETCGERVAVTGDGINDAPALAAADIGVAMGETGSDVAREAGDIILADDNFTTITRAIQEGRGLFENLKKGVRYYLACKVALVSVTLLPVLLSIPVPFAPIQIILMELFIDLAAAATFVAEPTEGDLMSRPPRNPSASFMDRSMISSIFKGALGLFLAVSTAYLVTWYRGTGQVAAQTVAFTAWLIGHVLLAMNMRSERQPFKRIGFFSNPFMILWTLAALAFVILVTMAPWLHMLFKTTSLNASQWGLILITTFIGTFWMEIEKIIRSRENSRL